LHERDAAYLWDIVNAARELTRFLAGKLAPQLRGPPA